MEKIIQIIERKDWQEILEYSKSLSQSERFTTIKMLHEIDIDKDILKKDGSNLTGTKRNDFYKNRQQINDCLNYFFITCTRNYEDLKRLEIQHEYGTYSPFLGFISTDNYQPLIEFYKLFPPDYLDRIFKDISKERFRNINFKILWKCYENKWITFDEAFFIRSLLVIPMFQRSTLEDAEFLFENRDALENVFLKFYKHETPILDISKWQAREGFVCKKVYEFWTEVIILLQEKGYEFERGIVSNLFESLINNWKKQHLDWHVRLLNLFNPTANELIENQSVLFSILGTGHPSLINYAMQCIKSIYRDEHFNKTLFIESFTLTFSNEKISKSILIGLQIMESFLSESFKIEMDYRENLEVLLMQADIIIQEKVSQLLVKYFNDATLKQSLEPYKSYLKQKPKEILKLEDEPASSISDAKAEKKVQPINPITSWDELLLHIGTCIRTQSATDIDIFYEGLILLQSELPSDYKKQLKPYTKQLFNRIWENYTMQIFSGFMERWITESFLSVKKEEHNPIPFLAKKTDLVLNKLKSKNNLPFLSTPTHEPFFVHPAILLDKLLKYEETKTEVDLEDLIVACNRIIVSEINDGIAVKSKKIKGDYSEAIQYLFGATKKINYTISTLPLWTQISRIRNPNGIFPEYSKSSASDYPTVVEPFKVNFKIETDSNQYATWYRLILDGNWNYTWYNKEKSKQYPHLFYNTASTDKASRVDILYQLSLNPAYLDAYLCRYIPDTSTGNEVSGFEECLFPIQFILENQLTIYHSGWLYVAVCLLFEKKISRDLASEYIHLAISRKENLDYLAKTISVLLCLNFAPVNRFIEYLDKPCNYNEVKHFQYQVLANCILSFEKDNMPKNSKKIIQYYTELLNFLKLEIPEKIEEKLNKLKK